MGTAHQPGGIYKNADGEGYHDSEGKPVAPKEAKSAVKKAEKEGPPAAPTATGTTPASTSETEPKKGSLPADFPHRDALEAEGITSYGKLREVEVLTDIPGIGAARAAEIEAALKA